MPRRRQHKNRPLENSLETKAHQDPLQAILDAYDWKAGGEALEEELRPIYEKLIGIGVDGAKKELGELGIADYEITQADIKKVLDLLAQKIKDVQDTTRENIQRIIDKQTEQGLSIYETAKLIEEHTEIDSASRATTIARTESAVAYNQGTLLTYGAGGVSKVQVYDGDQDPDCKEADGQVWTIEEAGANPIAHPNCVRAFSPVVE